MKCSIWDLIIVNDIQCALGLSQLSKLQRFIRRRQQIVDCYNAAFKELGWFKTPEFEKWTKASENLNISWHLYSPQIDFEVIKKTRTDVMKELLAQGVGSQVLYIPVYLHPWYQREFGYYSGMCPKSEAFYQKSLSLPLYPSMSDDDVEKVISSVLNLSI